MKGKILNWSLKGEHSGGFLPQYHKQTLTITIQNLNNGQVRDYILIKRGGYKKLDVISGGIYDITLQSPGRIKSMRLISDNYNDYKAGIRATNSKVQKTNGPIYNFIRIIIIILFLIVFFSIAFKIFERWQSFQ